MEDLSGLDARFVYGESPTVHMHTLKVAVIDPSGVPGGYTADRVREVLSERMHLLAPFRRRLVEIPWALGHPVWIEDPDFDLARHVVVRHARAPGGRAELDDIVSEVAGSPLARDRPLWEVTIVEGLARGRVGFVAKIHHALADGRAAVELLLNVLDEESTPRPPPAPAEPWHPEPLPGRRDLVVHALGQWLRLWRGLPGLVARTVRGLRRRARLRRERRVRLPRPMLDPPRTAFNRSLTPRRIFVTTELPLAEMKQIKRAFGVTLNDVVLAECGGALRALLREEGALPTRPLVAGVPLGADLDDSTRLWGNRVDNMFVTLATDVADPVERLRVVHEVASAAKALHDAMGIDLFEDWAGFTPPAVFAGIMAGWARSHLADRFPPPINCVVSNVAGPRRPLYVAGARLCEMYSVGPILEGIGLNVTVWSYLDRMEVSALACPDLGPDLRRLVDHLHAAHAELLSAAA